MGPEWLHMAVHLCFGRIIRRTPWEPVNRARECDVTGASLRSRVDTWHRRTWSTSVQVMARHLFKAITWNNTNLLSVRLSETKLSEIWMQSVLCNVSIHTNEDVIILKFSLLDTLKVVILTTSSAASDKDIIKMTTFLFQCTLSKLILTIKHTGSNSVVFVS